MTQLAPQRRSPITISITMLGEQSLGRPRATTASMLYDHNIF